MEEPEALTKEINEVVATYFTERAITQNWSERANAFCKNLLNFSSMTLAEMGKRESVFTNMDPEEMAKLAIVILMDVSQTPKAMRKALKGMLSFVADERREMERNA